MRMLLFTALPLAIAASVLALFAIRSRASIRADQQVASWAAHSLAVWQLELASDRFLDAVERELSRHGPPTQQVTLARRALTDARGASSALAHLFSAQEVDEEARLGREIAALVEDADAVLRAARPERLDELRARYQQRVVPMLNMRMREEHEGINASVASQHRQNVEFVLFAGGVTSAMVVIALVAAIAFARRVSKALTALSRQARTLDPGGAPDAGATSPRDELAALALTLSDLSTSLARQREGRVEVLASLAHDIRNPLAALKIASDADFAATVSSDDLQRAMTLVRRQVAHLEQVVDELLDVTAIEKGRMDLHVTETDLSRLARDCVELYVETSPNHTLALRAPEDPVAVRCDPVRIRRALDNLLGNAVKYSPSGGSVTVELTTSADEVTIAVSDSGPGIEPQDQQRIFEPYQRASYGANIAGVGLGLAISKHIAAAHGGTLEVESAPGRGSTFLLHLPVTSGVAGRAG